MSRSIISLAEISLGNFTSLPREIRNDIWIYVLDLDSQPEEYYKGSPASHGGANLANYLRDDSFPWPWERTALLRVSRQIYSETLNLMMSTNQFMFFLSPSAKDEDNAPIDYVLRFQLLRGRHSLRDCDSNTIPYGRNWNMMPLIRFVKVLTWDCDLSTMRTPSSKNGMSFCGYLARIAASLTKFKVLEKLEVEFTFSQIGWPDEEDGDVGALMESFLGLRSMKVVDFNLTDWECNLCMRRAAGKDGEDLSNDNFDALRNWGA